MKAHVTDFPYDSVPHYRAEDVALKKKILNAYYFFGSRAKVLQTLIIPLKELLQTEISLRISHFSSQSLDELVSSLSEDSLLGVVNLEPHGKKAVLEFEPVLAKIMVHRLLSGEILKKDQMHQWQLKPLTSLEEAVVQYFLVSLIEKMSSQMQPTNFTVTYNAILRSSNKLLGLFSNQDQLAVFSLQLHLIERDFYIKFILPLSVADDMGITKLHEELAQKRLQQFEKFDTQFQLEVAHVSLEPQDVDQLRVGDIILFDDMSITMDDHKVKGQGQLKLATNENNDGYLVELDTKDDCIRAKVISTL